jgi:hypothetical protein
MPILTFVQPDGSLGEISFLDGQPAYLGTEPNGGQAAPAAVIARSQVYQVPVIVPMRGQGIAVDGRRVVGLRVLRQGSHIKLGRADFTFWEMVLRQAPEGGLGRQRCPVCRMNFAEGEEYVVCPRCGLPHHKECWFEHEFCTNPGCLYPIRASMQRVLGHHGVTFEELAANSPLITQGRKCPAGTPGVDAQPFMSGQKITYCPNPTCNAAFHLECWVGLELCPVCQKYSPAKLLRAAFTPGAPPYFGEAVIVNAESMPEGEG